MEVPCIEEVRGISTSAKHLKEVCELVGDIAEGVYKEASCGKRQYMHPFDTDASREIDEINDLAFQKFVDEGYTVEKYLGVVKVKW